MQKIVLACVDLSKRDPSGFDLMTANLTAAKQETTKLTCANLTNAKLTGASWTPPRFRGST